MARRLKEYAITLDEVLVNESAGKGSFGAVYKCRYNGANCVKKKIHDILLGYGEYEAVEREGKAILIDNFIREIELLKNQRHPNIVQFLGVCGNLDGDLGSISLVMEYMEVSLRDFIPNNKKVLSLGMKISILKDVACGVSHLHSQNIVHRDLSDGNVLLSASLQAKVADLGVARAIFPVAMRPTSPMTRAPGAVTFMPPETLKKTPKYDVKLDCFSFGHLTLFLLIERNPSVISVQELLEMDLSQATKASQDKSMEIFRRHESLTTLGNNHPLCPMILSCLSDEPTRRPTMKKVREDLRALLTAMSDRGQFKLPSIVSQEAKVQSLEEALRGKAAQLAQRGQQVQTLEETLRSKDAQIAQREQQVQTLEETLRSKDAQIAQREQQVQTLEETLRSKDAQIAQREQQVQTLEETLRSKDAQIAQREQQVRTLEETLRSKDAQVSQREQQVPISEDSPRKVDQTPPSSIKSLPVKPLSKPEDSIVPSIKLTPIMKRNTSRVRAGNTPPPSVGGGAYSLTSTVSYKRRGQKSIVRQLVAGMDEEDEFTMKERQKQQERFREAQIIQREMSQIELQYEELEEVARKVEQSLRDSEGTSREEECMKQWLGLTAKRNVLVRRTQELSLQMKLLELEDREYELEKAIRDLQSDDKAVHKSLLDKQLEELVEVIEERNNIIKQVEQDRQREEDEELAHSCMLSNVFGLKQESLPERTQSADSRKKNSTSKKKKKRPSWLH